MVYGPGGTPIYQVTASGIRYYHQDQLGSTRLTTNSAGNVVARYGYSAYGEMATNTSSSGEVPVLGFAGQYTDVETGFVYLRARYMDPETGQFLTKDPLAAATRSPYAYADADPINRAAPTGTFALLASRCRRRQRPRLACRCGATLSPGPRPMSSTRSGRISTRTRWTSRWPSSHRCSARTRSASPRWCSGQR